MAKQTIAIGTTANDGTGSSLRAAFDICNDNFTEIYDAATPSGANVTLQGDVTVVGEISLADNKAILLGSGGDAFLKHTGSGLSLFNDTGNIQITNRTDDGDIIFESDNGSGGTTEYFKLDGSIVSMVASKDMVFNDDVRAEFGSAGDFDIYHNGTDSYLVNNTGHIYIKNNADDKDIIFQSDDGSGSTENYIQIDGSEGRTLFNKNIRVNDNVEVQVGGSADLKLTHDSNHSYIKNYTGDLYIENFADDKDVIFKSDDGSGGVAEYMRLDGGTTSIIVSASLGMYFNDGVAGRFGTHGDLIIYHDGTDSFLSNYTGDLIIGNNADDKDIIFQSDDGSGGVETYFKLDGGDSSANPLTLFPDNARAGFGASADLIIYHDASNSYIQEQGTGDLRITTSGGAVRINKGVSESIAAFIPDGAVELYHDNTKTFETTSAGVTITGTSASNSLLINGGADAIAKVLGTTSGARLDLQTNSHHRFFQTIESDGRFRFYDQTNGAERFTITSAGNVGIGTTSPAYKIDISGSLRATGESTFTSNLLFPDSSRIKLGTGEDLQIYHDGSNSYVSEAGTGNLILGGTAVRILNSALNEQMFRADEDDGVQLYFNNAVKFATTSTGATVTGVIAVNSGTTDTAATFTSSDASVAVDFVASDNSMQIATSSTDGILKNNGGGSLRFFNNGSERVRVDSSGNVGIGTTAPNATALEVVNNTSFSTIDTFGQFIIKSASGSTGDLLNFGVDATNSLAFIQAVERGVDSIPLILQRYGGSVGIGTTSPSSLLHLESASSPTLRIVDTTNSATLLAFAQDANTGFGNFSNHPIIFYTNSTTALTLDTSQNATFAGDVSLADSKKVSLGASDDFNMSHNGTDTTIQNITGHLNITNKSNDSDIIFKCDDGSGGITEYFKLDGSQTIIDVATRTLFRDSVKATFGAGYDLEIYHDGTNSVINNTNGDLQIYNNADDKDIVFLSDDGSGGTAEYMKLDGSDNVLRIHKRTIIDDNVKIDFGGGQDLQIYHDGSNSYVEQAGTGDLIIRNSADDKDILLQTDDGSGGVTSYIQLDGSDLSTKILTQKVILSNLPTSDPANAGQLYNDSGTLKISAG